MNASDSRLNGQGAAEFTAALFARDLTNALTSSNALVGGSTFSSRQGQLAKDFNDRMKVVACEYMEGKPDDDVFGPRYVQAFLDLFSRLSSSSFASQYRRRATSH